MDYESIISKQIELLELVNTGLAAIIIDTTIGKDIPGYCKALRENAATISELAEKVEGVNVVSEKVEDRAVRLFQALKAIYNHITAHPDPEDWYRSAALIAAVQSVPAWSNIKSQTLTPLIYDDLKIATRGQDKAKRIEVTTGSRCWHYRLTVERLTAQAAAMGFVLEAGR